MDAASPLLIPAGTAYSARDLTHYAGKGEVGLDEAIARADVLVTAPHAGAAIPEELVPFLAPEFTRRLQFDFTDCSTSPVVRRWAEIDPRIVVVENPHPRMIRDPNREKPADLAATLREAFARVRAAGAWNRVDLSGVDAIRPVTFSFFPLLRVPQTDGELEELVERFSAVAERGLGVYERTRDELIERFTEQAFALAAPGAPTAFTMLAFHDTMNHTTTRDGAISVDRAPEDRLPGVVALSNRGDHRGEPIDGAPVTMRPELLRRLADAARHAFDVADPAEVAPNQPYLGSYEIIAAGRRFRELDGRADAAGVVLSAVQAEFRREFLLGEANTRTLMQPGTGWIEPDRDRVDAVAQACKEMFDEVRPGLVTPAA
ncbi:N-formylglutamate amidohydrolase [Agromyces sp. NPDC056379]|uniref:N-formylglutamate amidohydrolase n=1 Tax=unclassified Agromyces TaxID=2639701 RepID=UPI0035D8FC86